MIRIVDGSYYRPFNRIYRRNFYIYIFFRGYHFPREKEENYSSEETVLSLRKKIFTIEGESLVKTCHFSCAKI